jgi:hypothetical protein
MSRDESLLEFASERQREILEAYWEHGSVGAAGRALGVSHGTVSTAFRRVRRKAARSNPKMHAPKAPEGYHLRGVSTLVDAGGNVKQQWIKTHRDREMRHDQLLDAIESALDRRSIPVLPTVEPPSVCDSDLLTVYPLGDPHIGLLSWPLETGQDFNLEIAERNLTTALRHLVDSGPSSETALIANLGDYFHSDSQANVTARSGHQLDVDGRWAKVLMVGVTAMEQCIELALARHERVIVDNRIGNHDDHSAIVLAVALAKAFRDNPRVEVNLEPGMFFYHEHGACLIGTTHGHTVKAQNLPGLMAADRPEQWGRTKFRHWYTGHVHHESVKEYAGCTVETARILAARDAWHHGQGYRSGRSMVCDVWHKSRGRILRHEIGIEQVEGVADAG